jgi:DNA-binding NarL/FixJ family response regulator
VEARVTAVAPTPKPILDTTVCVTTTRVVLGEDSFIARQGLIRALDAVDAVEVVAVCGDIHGLREAVDDQRPHVVLTDIRMPPTGTDEGIQLARELRTTHPDVGVVVLSQYVEPAYAMALFDSGTHRRGYVVKDALAGAEELGNAIRTVAGGGSVVDPRIVDELVGQWNRPRSPLDRLTPREREVLQHIATGASNGAIAGGLGISVRGVERHVNAIFAKLELAGSELVNRRVCAALVYLGHGDAPRDAFDRLWQLD